MISTIHKCVSLVCNIVQTHDYGGLLREFLFVSWISTAYEMVGH